MLLDLRRDGQLSVEHAMLISSLEPEVRSKYNQFITELVERNGVTNFSWFLRVTCRNPHLSGVLDSFCRLSLLDKILSDQEAISVVKVDTKAMKLACHQIISKYDCNVKIELDHRKDISDHLFINILKSIYWIINQFICARLAGSKSDPEGAVTFLDTFLFVDSFDQSGNYVDRYYSGLTGHVVDIKKIWYAPTLIGFTQPMQYLKIFRAIRSVPEQFLLKEQWLTLADYIKAFFQSFKIPGSIQLVPLWEGIDVSALISRELRFDRGSTALINPLLIYFFVNRLRLANVEIDVVVDWSENQVIDRALVMAVRRYYPDTSIKGYQGYIVPDYYACKDPIECEVSAKTVPDVICVIGEAFVEHKKKYCSSLKVSKAPAFRFSPIHEQVSQIDAASNEILAVLPISLEESAEILGLCFSLAELAKEECKIIIKQHPSYTQKRIKGIFPELKTRKSVQFASLSLYEHLSNARLLVSMSSSVCLEAVVLGIPVVIVGSRSGPTMNPLAAFKELKKYRICYDVGEVLDLLNATDSVESLNVNDYFEPITVSGVSSLLAPVN